MKNPVFFSICRYVPSLLRGEKVNIGFAYHVPSDGFMGFFTSKNVKRIRSFDDEIEFEMINTIFESLAYDFSSGNLETFDEYEEMEYTDPKLLGKKITNYVNQIQFGEVSVYEADESLSDTLEDIADMFLYYDKPKNKRMNHQRVQSLAKKIVKASNYKSSLTNATNNDIFYDTPYDFKITLGNQTKFVKALSFDYQRPNNFFKEMKSYLFDLEHESNNGKIDLKNTLIVINNTEFEKTHEQVIKNYLPSDLEIVTLESFTKMLNHFDDKVFH